MAEHELIIGHGNGDLTPALDCASVMPSHPSATLVSLSLPSFHVLLLAWLS